MLSRRRWPGIGAPLAVLLSAGVAALWLTQLSLRRDNGLALSAFDGAYFQQLVWGIRHGRWFESSFLDGSFLSLHFSPLLVLPAVIELAVPDYRVLNLVHAGAIVVSVPLAFLMLKALLAPARAATWLAAALSLPLPFTALTQQAALADFHTEVLALPALLVAAWAGLRGKPWILWAGVVLALSAKEDQVYGVAVLGLLLLSRGRGSRRRQGIAVLVAAAGWTAIVRGVVMPALRTASRLDTDGYYSWLTAGGSLITAPFREPAAVLAALTQVPGWLALLGLVAGLGFLPLLRPRWAVLMLPPLAALLLSHNQLQAHVSYHYGLLLIFPALVSAGMGGRRFLALTGRWRRPAPWHLGALRSRPQILLMLVALPLAIGWYWGHLPPARLGETFIYGQPQQLDAARAVASRIPVDAAVAADDDVAALAASRANIYRLPQMPGDAYVLVDRDLAVEGYFGGPDHRALLAGLATHRRLIATDGRFELWSPAN